MPPLSGPATLMPKRLLAAAAVAVALPLSALATKPCERSPCESESGGVDLAACARAADWIATGTITAVVHHGQGYPLLKDFADFTFVAQRWEKGAGAPGQRVRFRVGWCDNREPLPPDTSGTFRFYGEALPKDAASAPKYLHFERAPAAAPK